MRPNCKYLTYQYLTETDRQTDRQTDKDTGCNGVRRRLS